MTDRSWSKCQVCGKFISYDDLAEGKAKHEYYTDSRGEEAFDTYHVKCDEKTDD